AVLRGRVLALDGLEAHVGVSEVRARRGARRDEVAHHGRDLRDEIRAERGRHAGLISTLDAQRGWKGSTQTDSPAPTSPHSSSRMMKQFAAVIDVRIPEPCGPGGGASQGAFA